MKIPLFRPRLALLLIGILTLASGVQLVGCEVGSIGNGRSKNEVASLNSSLGMPPNGGCFGVSTVISEVEGAFAVISTDDIGGVYVAYQSHWAENSNESESIHVYFAYSHDYGRSWSESFRVDDDGRASVVCDSPSIAVDRNTGHVLVAWKDNRTGVAKAYIDKSVDRGVSFGPDVLVYDWPYDYVATWLPFTVNIEVSNDGKIYVAWIAYYSDSYSDCDIFFARSIDGGQTFSNPAIVNPTEGEARLAHPWVAIDSENVLYVAYSKRSSTSSGVYLATSHNGGSSFGPPAKVNDDPTTRYRGGTKVAVSPDGKIHVVWTDGRAGDGTQYLDIYYATSSDGGLSFSPNIRVNDDFAAVPPDVHPHFTRGAQGSPSIVTDSGSAVHIVWEDFRNFVDDTTYCRDIYYAYSENGTQFSKNLKVNYIHPDAVSVNCADPNIAIDSQDNFFMVFSDAPSGDNDHHQIYFAASLPRIDWVHYHNYTEIITVLSALNDTYPYVVDVFSIGKSWRNQDVFCVRLTNENNGKPKPEVLFVGYHHADERISAELPFYFVVYAATNFGLDKTMTSLLNECEIYVIAALNVDGFDLSEISDWQRKNARPIDEDYDGVDDEDPPEDENGNGLIEVLMDNTDPQNPEFLKYEGVDNDNDGINAEDWVGGVDLNRNYAIAWDRGVSDPSSEVYRGPTPFSEPETQAIRDLVLEHHFTYAISFHSGLEFIIYPWGSSPAPTPDEAEFLEIAQELSDITGGTQCISPTVMPGLWMDWMYGIAGVMVLTFEIFRNETWQDVVTGPGPYSNTVWEGGRRWVFNPLPTHIESVVLRWLPVFFYIANRTINEFLGADLNQDGTVNILDISMVAMAFGSTPDDPNWNQIADLNDDQIINILDISTIAIDFGKTV